jgi:hypothetical protein
MCQRIILGNLVAKIRNETGLHMIFGQLKNTQEMYHLYYWNEDSFTYLIKLFTKFSIIEMKKFSAYWSRNLLFRMLAWMFPILRPDIMVVLEK